MKPIKFKEMNSTLAPSKTGHLPLPVHKGNNHIISCWKGGIIDRLKFLITGRIWFGAMAQITHMPISLGTKCPFKKLKMRMDSDELFLAS